jgi:hypothetical protein
MQSCHEIQYMQASTGCHPNRPSDGDRQGVFRRRPDSCLCRSRSRRSDLARLMVPDSPLRLGGEPSQGAGGLAQ